MSASSQNHYRYLIFFVLIILSGIVAGCKGPEGPTGPQGTIGPQGSAGTAGPQGPAGNANVQQITYDKRTHTSADLFIGFPASFDADIIEKSLIYIYVKQSASSSGGQTTSYWFSVPGETVTGNEYSFYAAAGTGSTPGIFLRRVVNYHPGEEVFDAVRVLIIPASSMTNGRLAGGPEAHIKDYPVWNADIKKQLSE